MEAILIVLPEPERLASLMDAIKQAGAPGATIQDSQGQELLSWLGMHPAMTRFWSMEGTERRTSKTVLTIVPDEVVDAVIKAAEGVMDGFNAPNSGMLCSWSVGRFRCYQGDKPRATMAGSSR